MKTQKSQISMRFCVLFCALCGNFLSNFQLDGNLDISWIENIARDPQLLTARLQIGETVPFYFISRNRACLPGRDVPDYCFDRQEIFECYGGGNKARFALIRGGLRIAA